MSRTFLWYEIKTCLLYTGPYWYRVEWERGAGVGCEGGGERGEGIMENGEGKVCVLPGGPRDRAHFCFCPWKLGRGTKRGQIKFNGQARCHKTYPKENCTHLFSGAHIGHSLSVSAYPSKQLRKIVQRLRWFLRNKSYRWIFWKLSLNDLFQAPFRKIQ